MKDILKMENNKKNITLDEFSNEDNNALCAVVSLISLILHTSNQDEKTVSMLRKEIFDTMKDLSNSNNEREDSYKEVLYKRDILNILYNKDITFSDVVSFLDKISINELTELKEEFNKQSKEFIPEYFSSAESVLKKFEEYMAQRIELEEVNLLKEMEDEEISEVVHSQKNDKKMSKNKMFQMFQLKETAKLLEEVYKLYYKYLPRSNVYDNYIISNIGYMLPISSNFYLEVPPKNLTNLIKRTFTLYYKGIPYIILNADSLVNVVESAASAATFGMIGETPIHLATKVPEMLTEGFYKQSRGSLV